MKLQRGTVKAILVPMIWLLLIAGVMAIPYWLFERMMYYNFIVYDESPLAISIANDLFWIRTICSPLLFVLARFLHGGLHALLPQGRFGRFLSGLVEWIINVHLIVSCLSVVIAVIMEVITGLARW